MSITVNGQEHNVPFTYKTLRALCKKYGVKSLTEIEKLINLVSYSTAHVMVAELLIASGVEVSPDDVEDSIEDSHFPLLLIDSLNAAMMGPKAEEAKEMAENIASGN